MAMNENEGSSAYPPNPDAKSGSCLIAGFHQLSEVRPSYWNAYRTESGTTFSIDMVRLKLSFKVPAAMKRALEKEAKAEGKSTGAYARGILADGLMAIA